MSLLDQIKLVSKREYHPFDVKAWGVKVYVKSLSGLERAAYEDRVAEMREQTVGKENEVTIRIIAAFLQDCLFEDITPVPALSHPVDDPEAPPERVYARIFPDGDEGLAVLMDMGFDVLQDVFKEAQTRNAMSDDDVEDLAGNSDGARSASLHTV